MTTARIRILTMLSVCGVACCAGFNLGFVIAGGSLSRLLQALTLASLIAWACLCLFWCRRACPRRRG